MDLLELLDRTLPGMGYEVVDVQASSKGRLVRVFIDKPQGVDVEDCARVSDHLTRLFAVENIDDVVTRLRAHGAELVGELVQYENSYRLCYVRGPEGIIVALAEQLS